MICKHIYFYLFFNFSGQSFYTALICQNKDSHIMLVSELLPPSLFLMKASFLFVLKEAVALEIVNSSGTQKQDKFVTAASEPGEYSRLTLTTVHL